MVVQEELVFETTGHRDIHDLTDAGVCRGDAPGYFAEFRTVKRIVADAEQGRTVVLESNGAVVGAGALVGSEIRRRGWGWRLDYFDRILHVGR